MAKRKRLGPADPLKTSLSGAVPPPSADGSASGARVPIARVAGESAASAALAELTDQITEARRQGRMILELPVAAIDPRHLVRDRLVVDPEEMHSLVESIRERGQQTPIEAVDLGGERYGLISGWRRLEALKQLAAEGDERPALVLLRRPEDAADAYLAMVEENEIRVGLSYYERAAVAAAAVDQGVFETEKAALLHIYRTASRAKRSKIRSFMKIVRSLDAALVFPAAIGERLGLALAKMLEERPDVAQDLRASLQRSPPATPADEARRIEAALSVTPKQALTQPKPAKSKAVADTRNLSRDIRIDEHESGAVTLSGPGVTPAFRARLAAWLKSQ